VRRRTPEGFLFRARRRRREVSYWYKSKLEMKLAPSTPTVSVAAAISSPVTCGGRLGTLCHGRFGVSVSQAWAREV
jgi:hypothetical protein